jgi:CRP-like cAMP-binding protein
VPPQAHDVLRCSTVFATTDCTAWGRERAALAELRLSATARLCCTAIMGRTNQFRAKAGSTVYQE